MELKVHISNPLKDIFNFCNCDANLISEYVLLMRLTEYNVFIYTLAYYENLYDQI